MSKNEKTPMLKKALKKPEYQPVLRDLYKRLLYQIQLREQWAKPNTGFDYMSHALKYQAKAEALLELLESVTVFHEGGGAKMEFGRGFEYRVQSFAFLAEDAP